MELHHLRTFCEVARELSFTRAARNLYCAQSTVTAQIQCLEKSLGVPLFLRRGRCPIELTEAGEVLRPRAEQILAVVDATDQEIRGIRQPAKGRPPYDRGPGPYLTPASQSAQSRNLMEFASIPAG
jgi:DNA-binding transcriptional LysR family regulator